MMTTMMVSLISPARVVPHLYARDVWHVIEELTRLAAAETLLDHDAIREAVLERGEVSSFAFGRGIAIPHAAIPDLRHPVGVFARLKPAQDFGAADEIPADLAFLLLSPDGDDPTHLRTLACVVRRLRDREVAARLRSAKGAEAINVVLTSDAWRGTDARDRYSGETSAGAPGMDLTNVEMCTSIKPLC